MLDAVVNRIALVLLATGLLLMPIGCGAVSALTDKTTTDMVSAPITTTLAPPARNAGANQSGPVTDPVAAPPAPPILYADGNPVPEFSADPTSGSAPLTVQFTDESPGYAYNWRWTFGDGATSTEQNPVHTFERGGVYTVTLSISGKDYWSNDSSMAKYMHFFNSGQSKAVQVTVETAVAEPRLHPGDIVNDHLTNNAEAWVILKYDASTDEYQIVPINRYQDGQWGYFFEDLPYWASRDYVDRTFTIFIDHVDLTQVTSVSFGSPIPKSIITSPSAAPIVSTPSSAAPASIPITTTRSMVIPSPAITQPAVSSATAKPAAIQPTPIVIVAERTADIDPGMTRYSGPTAPPTTSEEPSTAPPTTGLPSTPITTVATTTAATTAAPPPRTSEAAVRTAEAPGGPGALTLYVMGAVLAVFGLVVGGIAYRSYASRRDAPVAIMPRNGPAYPAAPAGITPITMRGGTVRAPWDGYSPLASDSYDLLARLRRYEDGVRRTGSGRTVPLAGRLDLSSIPTLPIPAAVRELGPGVGCRVLSVDRLGNAVCLRDQGTAAERLDVVNVEAILTLIEEQYEQRWVPKERGGG